MSLNIINPKEVKMASDLPPGVTESMIPGNRPEDEEVEISLILTKGDIGFHP